MLVDLRSEVPPILLIDLSRKILRHESDCARVHIQCIDVMLCKEPDSQPRILANQSSARTQLSDQQLQHRRLTSSVRAYNSDSRIELNVQIHIP